MWFCESCASKLYEAEFSLEDIVVQLMAVMEKFYGDEALRTCKCGAVMEVPK